MPNLQHSTSEPRDDILGNLSRLSSNVYGLNRSLVTRLNRRVAHSSPDMFSGDVYNFHRNKGYSARLQQSVAFLSKRYFQMWEGMTTAV